MKNFTSIPNEIFEMNLTSSELLVYISIKSFCYGNKNYCYPSIESIAKKASLCVKTVQNCIKSLKNKGLLKVFYRANNTSIYTLNKIQKNSSLTSGKAKEQDFLNNNVDMTSYNMTTNVLENTKTANTCQAVLENLVNTLGLGESDSTVVLNLASFANLEVSHIILCGKGYSISDIKETLINLTPEQLERGLNKLHRYNVKNASAYLMAILVNKDTTSKATRTNTTTKATTKKKATRKSNKFNNFESRKYDKDFYESLERVNCI